MVDTSYQQAEALRKSGKYSEAVDKFAQLWLQSPNTFVGWRYAHCLRKVGRLEDAERVAKEALRRYPQDSYTKNEVGWILYEKELKPAKDRGDLPTAIDAASRIFDLNPDQLVRTKAVFTVVSLAKAQGKWETVLEWTGRISPDQLNREPTGSGTRVRVMPDREVWYVNRARALLELGRSQEARELAQKGMKEFPEDLFLRRTAALALAETDNLSGAIAEMRSLIAHPHADWYMKAELAQLEYRAGNLGESYRLLCEALATSRQSENYKLNHLGLLARIALALGKNDIAAAHVALAKSIRNSEGWAIPPELAQLEKDVQDAGSIADLPKDLEQLKRLCRRHWQQGAGEGRQSYRGTVKPYPEDRAFTFIERDDGGEDVFVLVKDLPPDCRKPGSHVEFAIVASFDRKKGRASTRATAVRRIG